MLVVGLTLNCPLIPLPLPTKSVNETPLYHLTVPIHCSNRIEIVELPPTHIEVGLAVKSVGVVGNEFTTTEAMVRLLSQLFSVQDT